MPTMQGIPRGANHAVPTVLCQPRTAKLPNMQCEQRDADHAAPTTSSQPRTTNKAVPTTHQPCTAKHA
eukprot:13975880-Alexandrium_andersonii.AAC.1